MFREEGSLLADLIYAKLQEKGYLTHDEVLDIIESDIVVFGLRKVTMYAFDKLHNELNVKSVPEGNYKHGLQLGEE